MPEKHLPFKNLDSGSIPRHQSIFNICHTETWYSYFQVTPRSCTGSIRRISRSLRRIRWLTKPDRSRDWRRSWKLDEVDDSDKLPSLQSSMYNSLLMISDNRPGITISYKVTMLTSEATWVVEKSRFNWLPTRWSNIIEVPNHFIYWCKSIYILMGCRFRHVEMLTLAHQYDACIL